MSTARTQTIQALEEIIAGTPVILNAAISLNQLIRERRLPLPQFDLPAIWQTQRAAEAMLLEMELRAPVAA